MKLLVIIFTFFSLPSLAQTTDITKYTKEEFIETISKKDKEFSALMDTLKKLKAEIAGLKSSKTNNLRKDEILEQEVSQLKQVIKQNNEVFLIEVFKEKYTQKYFQETKLEAEDKTEKIRNSDILIKSVSVGADRETLDLSSKAFDFNKNYIALYEIQKTVLNVKFDEKKVQESINTIATLPFLDSNSVLNRTKIHLTELLKNYRDNTCLLKAELDKLKKGIDQKALIPSYLKYEKMPRFNEYKYLLSVIVEMKKNVNSFTQDALQPCEEFKSPATNNQSKNSDPQSKKN